MNLSTYTSTYTQNLFTRKSSYALGLLIGQLKRKNFKDVKNLKLIMIITIDISNVTPAIEELVAFIFLLKTEAEYSFETLAFDSNYDNMQ